MFSTNFPVSCSWVNCVENQWRLCDWAIRSECGRRTRPRLVDWRRWRHLVKRSHFSLQFRESVSFQFRIRDFRLPDSLFSEGIFPNASPPQRYQICATYFLTSDHKKLYFSKIINNTLHAIQSYLNILNSLPICLGNPRYIWFKITTLGLFGKIFFVFIFFLSLSLQSFLCLKKFPW